MPDARDIADLHEKLQLLLDEAFDRGYLAGGEGMRQNILKAAGAPVAAPFGLQVQGAGSPIVGLANRRKPRGSKAMQRAPRGRAHVAIAEVLTTYPGISITEITDLVQTGYPDISVKTVGNALRRGEGEHYHRTDKYSWHLGRAPKTESAGQSPSETPRRQFDLVAEGR